MQWIGFAIAMTVFSGATGGALLASAAGWGLPGAMDEPMSIRQSSVNSRRVGGGGAAFFYFGNRRRHYGGGYRGGK